MVQINWTIRAKEDIKSIAAYISQDSVYYAHWRKRPLVPRSKDSSESFAILRMTAALQLSLVSIIKQMLSVVRRVGYGCGDYGPTPRGYHRLFLYLCRAMKFYEKYSQLKEKGFLAKWKKRKATNIGT